MFQIGYVDHFIALRQKYRDMWNSPDQPPYDWSLKEYGMLFVWDQISRNNCKKVLEIGPGFNTKFPENLQVDVEYSFIDKPNSEAGIIQNEERWIKANEKRKGAKFYNGFIGDFLSAIPENYFDCVFSVSVVEHFPDDAFPNVNADIFRVLKLGGLSVHSVDIYPSSKKANLLFSNSKANGFSIGFPQYTKWNIAGTYTTFFERTDINFLLAKGASRSDVWEKPPVYSCHNATILFVAKKETKSVPEQTKKRTWKPFFKRST